MTTATRTPVNSVGQMLRRRVNDTPHRRAYTFPTAAAPAGPSATWSTVTWAQVGRHSDDIAAGLISLGVRPGDRVGIASTTRYEWAVSAYGIMCAGAAAVAVYPTTVGTDVRHILGDSGATAVFVEDAEQLTKITGLRDDLPDLGTVIVLDNDVPDRTDGWVMTLDELCASGRQHLGQLPDDVDTRIDATGPEDLATLIYTSGTTGRPKGVLLPHRVWVHEVHAIEATVNNSHNSTDDDSSLLTIDDKQFLWLPLAHVMGKLMILLPLHIGFETTIDGRIDRIVENIGASRPTFMGSVPRIFEKAYTGIVTMTAEDPGPLGVREKLFHWASRVGVKALDTDSPSLLGRVQARIADRLVFSTVREKFGGNIRYFISGSAALNTDVSRWFWAAGLPVLEGYGMTECNVATLGLPSTFRAGTVGEPVDGFEVRTAEDGEILVRGPGVMAGYHNNPEETARALSDEGWLHTGDIGALDDQGRLSITDRKKELFKTSNGKYVAPALMEARFKGLCPVASQIVVVGEGRRHVAALISLDKDAITAWAGREGIPGDYEAVTRDPRTRDHLQGFVDELNTTLNPWERIKKFRILDRELSVDAQELTPSLKLRRTPVAEHFAADIEALYPANAPGEHHDH
ncbi:Acyl-CoA synthetase [Corynebacterium glyciniphilum AJ 3170]|uniref:Acyl-CoA synthetase n=1 Tax=Corynebacterium glyciniphilum AJ 3170 TaxID=1404245 RepID=X5DQX5_9CORY|nr:long-chain fatty acid--CoA ligase [Corynebacterium glyciniphilum]AHW63067.1 Acyl-CoA synthetase [Corynebacterium glyciniphilum AJ 3170]